MQLCSNCGHQNRAGVVFCENCGASLIGKMPLDTKSLEASSPEEKAQIGIDASVLIDVKVQGLAVFHDGDTLRLDIEGSPEPVKFKPKAETIFGRRDPATGAMPDVDLTPFAGYRMGVSRRHAAIRFGDGNNLDIWDLGSSNGTFLNGQRLSAHRPYHIHDGDELRLGQMMVRVYFDLAPKAPQAPESAKGAEATGASPGEESSKPELPAAQGNKMEVGAAEAEPALVTLFPQKNKPVTAPFVSSEQPKPEEAQPADTPKSPDNHEKRD